MNKTNPRVVENKSSGNRRRRVLSFSKIQSTHLRSSSVSQQRPFAPQILHGFRVIPGTTPLFHGFVVAFDKVGKR